MNCDCVEKIRKRLQAHHSSDIELDMRQTVNLEAETDSDVFAMALPPLNYRYKVGKQWRKSFVAFNYCPFCGKKDA